MDYLVHHGIKGQRWGVRRYQNEDGSYTDLGRRNRANKAATIAATRAFNKDVRRTKFAGDTSYETQSESMTSDQKRHLANSVQGSIKPIKGAIEEGRNSRRQAKRAAETRSALEDAKNMTDAELKQRINRLNLENNYVNAISQQQASNGRDTVDSILAYTGTILGVAGAAVGIWATISGMKK